MPGKHHQIILALHNRRTKRASSNDGMVRPSALAAVQLITSFYLLGACTGRFGSKAKPRPLLQQLTESRLTGRSENVPQHDPPIHFLARCPSCRSPAILPLRPSCVVCALVGSLFADRGRCCQLGQGGGHGGGMQLRWWWRRRRSCRWRLRRRSHWRLRIRGRSRRSREPHGRHGPHRGRPWVPWPPSPPAPHPLFWLQRRLWVLVEPALSPVGLPILLNEGSLKPAL